jgi:hypothetical protein
MGQLAAGVLEKRIDDLELTAPEVVTVSAEVGEQRISLLGEGRENSLLDLGVLGSVDNAVTHVDQELEVVLRCRRGSVLAYVLIGNGHRRPGPCRPCWRHIRDLGGRGGDVHPAGRAPPDRPPDRQRASS